MRVDITHFPPLQGVIVISLIVFFLAMTKTALLVIYNHRFDKNIPRIDKLYEGRFSDVYHIVPFYDGTQKNVIPVYDSSFQFQGYISQAYAQLRDKGYTHYFVVADDMIINPALDENNYLERIGLGEHDCFLDYILVLQELKEAWRQTEAMAYKVNLRGVEVEKVLPSREVAEARFAHYGLPTGPIPVRPMFDRRLRFILKYMQNIKRRNLDYPLLGGYCDILVLTSDMMDKFCLYCGAFAATRLFAEFAIPTAMILASDNVKTSKDTLLGGTALWSKEDKAFLEAYNGSLQALVDDFPADKLFFHPIKLSQWK